MGLFGDKEQTDTSLQHSKVGRDLAGRDIINNNYITEDNASDYIDKIYSDFKEECNTNQDKKKVVEELERYKSKLEGDVLGLEEKLERGNLSKLYFYAERAKEAFTKKLFYYENSKSAQNFFVHLLSNIESNFHMYVLMELEDEMSKKDVMTLIKKYIKDEIRKSLKENLLKINSKDIDGMLFYLTGNCYINWE